MHTRRSTFQSSSIVLSSLFEAKQVPVKRAEMGCNVQSILQVIWVDEVVQLEPIFKSKVAHLLKMGQIETGV